MIPEISKELNISEEILINFENNHLDENIDFVFTLGHLRSYSSYLNLDHNIIEYYLPYN